MLAEWLQPGGLRPRCSAGSSGSQGEVGTLDAASCSMGRSWLADTLVEPLYVAGGVRPLPQPAHRAGGLGHRARPSGAWRPRRQPPGRARAADGGAACAGDRRDGTAGSGRGGRRQAAAGTRGAAAGGGSGARRDPRCSAARCRSSEWRYNAADSEKRDGGERLGLGGAGWSVPPNGWLPESLRLLGYGALAAGGGSRAVTCSTATAALLAAARRRRWTAPQTLFGLDLRPDLLPADVAGRSPR
ncbi:MAG: hypothetical protein MZW92_07950 [Comamonadaceae bacterium]|nr:hypothetical protein [Comamonadaceae bacterium]